MEELRIETCIQDILNGKFTGVIHYKGKCIPNGSLLRGIFIISDNICK
jgi:hypothetical protein